jgi:hypothetical protein
MSETRCATCELIADGNCEAVNLAGAIHANRMVLAVLNGDPDTAALFGAELKACRECIARLAAALLMMYAGALTRIFGGTDAAARATEHVLAEDLDTQVNATKRAAESGNND